MWVFLNEPENGSTWVGFWFDLADYESEEALETSFYDMDDVQSNGGKIARLI